MARPGHIDLTVSFPDRATGRGVVVNTLAVEVVNMFGRVVDAFTLGDGRLIAEPTLIDGVVYVVYDYDVSDPAKTPGTTITLRSEARIGAITLMPNSRVVSFRPASRDVVAGVLVEWPVSEAMASVDRGDEDRLFYEIRRVDERTAGTDFAPSFSPNMYTAAYWSLNGALTDITPYPAHLTNVNGLFIREEAQVSPVRLGGNGYLWAANPSKLSYGAGIDFSMSVLLRVSLLKYTGFVMGKMGLAGTKGYGIRLEPYSGSYYPVLYVGGGAAQYTFTSSIPLVQGRFHNIVATFDRDGMASLYIDAQFAGAIDISPVVGAVFDQFDFRFGAEDDVNPNFLYGDVAQGIMFNGILSQLDVTNLYNDMLGDSSETILGRTAFSQFLDTDITDPFQMRHYLWRVYKAEHVATGGLDGTDYRLLKIFEYNYKQVKTASAPLCFVQGRLRQPSDMFPSEAYVKFYVGGRDSGQFVHGRYLGDDEIIVFPDRTGQFGAYLIQDAVMICHIPEAHLALRFAVPRQSNAVLDEIETERLKLTDNI